MIFNENVYNIDFLELPVIYKYLHNVVLKTTCKNINMFIYRMYYQRLFFTKFTNYYLLQFTN